MAESAGSTSKRTQKFKWTIGMVDDLLGALRSFKSTMDYQNLDFNADKVKQYEAVRQTVHSRCRSYFENKNVLAQSSPPWASSPRVIAG